MIYKYLGDIAEIKGGKRMPKGTRLQQEKNQHPYLRITDYDGKSLVEVANVKSPKTGIKLKVSTNLPGFQFYWHIVAYNSFL